MGMAGDQRGEEEDSSAFPSWIQAQKDGGGLLGAKRTRGPVTAAYLKTTDVQGFRTIGLTARWLKAPEGRDGVREGPGLTQAKGPREGD